MEWTLVIELTASYGNKQSDSRIHLDLDFIITIIEPSNYKNTRNLVCHQRKC